jgi:hypothetical protein
MARLLFTVASIMGAMEPVDETESPHPNDLGALGTQMADALAIDAIPMDAAPLRGVSARGAALAAACVLLVAAPVAWRTLSAGMAPGVWIGFALAPAQELPAPLPPYWHMLSGALGAGGWLAPPQAVQLLAAVAALSLAIAASVLAADLCARGSGRDGALPVILGAITGIAAFLSAPVQAAMLGGGPEALAAASAVAGLALFLRAHELPGLPPGLLAAGAMLGVAIASQPYFLTLAAMCFFVMFLLGPQDGRQLERFAATAFVILFFAAWPALQLLQGGAGARALLEYVLNTPYPDASFQPGEFPRDGIFSPVAATVLLASSAFTLLACRASRRSGVALALAIVLLWPCMPYLANPPHEALTPVDTRAPLLAAAVLLMALAFAGAGGLRAVFPPSVPTRVAAFALVAALLVVVVLEGQRVVDRRNVGAARMLGSSLVDGAPHGAVLVAGRLDIAGTLWALQRVEGIRKDLHVLPGAWLTRPDGRAAAAEILDGAMTIGATFPENDAIARWREELPLHLAALNDGVEAHFDAGLRQFALWDLASRSVAPVYFLGEPSPWLAARGVPQGRMLAFPPPAHPTPPQTAPGTVAAVAPEMQAWIDACNTAAATARDAATLGGGATPQEGAVAQAATDLLERARAAEGKLSEELRIETDALWRADRLCLLRAVYEVLAKAPGAEPAVHYQLAAVYAQLGQWEAVSDALATWLASAGDENGAAFVHVANDSRFALYRRRVGGEFVKL